MSKKTNQSGAQGWISIHRSMADHWLWSGEKFTKGQAWIDLLMHANHKENKVMIKGRLVVIQRGEQIRSQVTLAETWKWNPRTVKKFLELLISDSMITLKTTELTTHITICNYDTFQNKGRKSAEHNTEHSAEGVQSTIQSTVQTNNNANNGNNEKNDNKKEDVFIRFWENYPKKSDKKKAETAFNRLSNTKKELAIIDCKTRYLKTEKKYIPLATTYIHGERWDDEIEKQEQTNHAGFEQRDYQACATNIEELEWAK